MTILEHIKQSIADGLPARLTTQGGATGVLFLDEGEFIPFTDLNYNPEYGYFRISLLPNMPRQCENEPVSRRNLNRGATGRVWAENDTRVTGYVPASWADQLVRLGENQSDAVRIAVDVVLHPFEDAKIDPIRLADPLPCGIRTDKKNCTNPATVAYAYPWRHPTYPYHYVLLPVCRNCAEKAVQNYGLFNL